MVERSQQEHNALVIEIGEKLCTAIHGADVGVVGHALSILVVEVLDQINKTHGLTAARQWFTNMVLHVSLESDAVDKTIIRNEKPAPPPAPGARFKVDP